MLSESVEDDTPIVQLSYLSSQYLLTRLKAIKVNMSVHQIKFILPTINPRIFRRISLKTISLFLLKSYFGAYCHHILR